jgi:Clostripain family
MKLLRSIALILGFLNTAQAQSLNPRRPWLAFVYIAGDNNLWPEADKNIDQMAKASKTSNGYIVVYLNIKRDGQKKQTQQLLIQDGAIIPQGPITVEDSGDPKTLIKALSWAITEFPSDNILVDLWNHGSGSLNRGMMQHRGICYDDSTGHYLTDLDYKHAFDVIVNQYRGGKKIDIITFDACLMADIEVAFTLQPYANYLVSSQQTVPGPGFNYTTVLNALATSSPSPENFAQSIVHAFDSYYKSCGLSYTLSAIDLSKLTTVINATNSLAVLLCGLLKNDTSKTLTHMIGSVISNFIMPKLYTLCSNLYLYATKAGLSKNDAEKLKTATRTCMAAIAQAVFANVRSADLVNAKGISIYFADTNYGMEPSYPDLYWSKINPAWANFLNNYLAKAS